jgi:putative membrane protein
MRNTKLVKLIFSLIINAIAVFAAAYLLPQVSVDAPLTALWVALVLGVLNSTLKPILKILTLPINFLTLGLFGLLINLLILYLATLIVPGFVIAGILGYILFSLVTGIVASILHAVIN